MLARWIMWILVRPILLRELHCLYKWDCTSKLGRFTCGAGIGIIIDRRLVLKRKLMVSFIGNHLVLRA